MTRDPAVRLGPTRDICLADQRVDDELLFRVITGAATETEREALAVWLKISPGNEQRLREVASVLDVLAADEAALAVPHAPTVSSILARARLAGGHQYPPARPRLRRLAVLGFVAAALGLGLLLDRWSPPAPALPPFGGERMTTGPGNSVGVTLKDGTRVELGPNSTISTAQLEQTREVQLEGRASFMVAPQAGRAFVVRTSAGETRDIGTYFTVREDRGSMQVAVFEGRVGFSNADGSAEAGAGEMIATSPGRKPVVSRLAAGHSSSDWVRAALVLERTPVAEIAPLLQKRYGVTIHIGDAAVGRRTVSAWFVQEPSLDEVFTAVCRAVDASCSIDGSHRVISQ